jgi:glycolate oxidase
VPVTPDTAAHLIIEVDGNHMDTLMSEMESISELLLQYECGEIYFAEDHQQKNELWKLRRRVAEVVKTKGYTIEEDTVVPRALLPELIKDVKELGKRYGFTAVCYGHAGDGNLHIRLNKPGIPNSFGNQEMHAILRELFVAVKKLGGTISGEHGVGLIQKGYMDVMFEPVHFRLMKEIKKAFDPNNILNAGKIFD